MTTIVAIRRDRKQFGRTAYDRADVVIGSSSKMEGSEWSVELDT
jgi:hypothetical protein